MMAGERAMGIGMVLGGRYRLVRVLGSGGMGTVFEALDAQGAFAIKLLSDFEERDAMARFAREARIAWTLSHPNIARVVASGVDPTSGAPYLVMELLHGEDLESVLQRFGPLPPRVAVRILLGACAGVEAAHMAGVIHRDLKPSNIFLHRASGGEVTVKVCDFGLAKQIFGAESISQSDNVFGSPAYMSPEQATSSKNVDGRADVWSLAMTLYRALTGVTAFHHKKTVADLLLALSSEDVPHIQDKAPWVPKHLARVVHGALLRDLGARCPNVSALGESLEAFAEVAEPLRARELARISASDRATHAPRAPMPPSWDDVEAHADAIPCARRGPVRLLGQTLGGRYPLLRVIGRGGMGAVYETHGTRGEPLAIKVILADVERREPEALRRFVREARAAMAITSPHVVRVVDADADGAKRVPFIVMERLEGQDLAALLRAEGPLQAAPAAHIFAQACRGLRAAHDIGVVHRDIKPANLFLHELPSGEVVTKICDFGLAKTVYAGDAERDITQTGGVLGSPMYFSPEQAKNAKTVDHRSDIFSLCVSLYEALSGRRPWDECGAVGEIILALCTKTAPRLEEIAPWIPQGLARVVHKGMEREPDARYASSAELYAALAPFAGDVDKPLLRSFLAGVPARASAHRAHPRRLEVGADTTATAATVKALAQNSASRLRPSLAVAGITAAAAGVAVWVALSRPSAAPARATAPPSVVAARPPQAAPDPPVKRATLRVVLPPYGILKVGSEDWTSRVSKDGRIELSGQANTAFHVAIYVENKPLVSQEHILYDDDLVEPASIEASLASHAPRPAAKGHAPAPVHTAQGGSNADKPRMDTVAE
jgi:serine/threonine protein kinase